MCAGKNVAIGQFVKSMKYNETKAEALFNGANPDELSTHEGIDMSKSSVWTYRKIRKNLAEFIGEKYRLTDLAFG